MKEFRTRGWFALLVVCRGNVSRSAGELSCGGVVVEKSVQGRMLLLPLIDMSRKPLRSRLQV